MATTAPLEMTHLPGEKNNMLIGLIGEEVKFYEAWSTLQIKGEQFQEMCVGFLLAGIGQAPKGPKQIANYMIVEPHTSEPDIIAFLTALMERPDIAIVLVSVDVADRIRPTMVKFKRSLIPNVLEIPSKAHPYNVNEDEIILLAMVSIIFLNLHLSTT